MNIILCVNRDIESNIALNRLMPLIIDKHKISIILSEKVGNKNINSFHELSHISQEKVNLEIFPLANEKYNGGIKFFTFEKLSSYYNCPTLDIKNINDPSEVKKIEEIKPDLIVSIRYGKIFSNQIIAIPKYGIINLHSGILPDYKGVIASFRAMQNNEEYLGMTLHYVNDSTVDTGDIIDIFYTKINKDKSLFWHIINLYLGDNIVKLANYINQIGLKKLEIVKQNPNQGKYYTYPTREEIEAFKEKYKIYDETEYKQLLKMWVN